MTTKLSIPRGTADILPEHIFLWQDLESTARSIFHAYNYKEMRTPIFEDTALFARSVGQTSEIVQKQMLNLASQKLTEDGNIQLSGLSLRPEGTASVVRSYIGNHIDKKEKISKLYYIGPMFRGERPQKGRLRQFHQIGAEVIGPGAGHPYLDAEVISLCIHILKDFGLSGFKLKINTLGSPSDKQKYADILKQKFMPYLKNLPEALQNRYQENIFRILDSKDRQSKEIVQKVKIDDDYLSKDSREHFDHVKQALDSLGIEYEHDQRLVRGLDYYTHTVFEIKDDRLGSQDALGAGGRYNNLVRQLGGEKRLDIFALGFALGIERILIAMPKKPSTDGPRVQAYILPMNVGAFIKAFDLAKDLRTAGVSCDINYSNIAAGMRQQMTMANKSQARFAVIIGEDELKEKVVSIKNMDTGAQEKIACDDWNTIIKKLKEA